MTRQEKEKAAASGGGQSRKAIRQAMKAAGLTGKALMKLTPAEIRTAIEIEGSDGDIIAGREIVGRDKLAAENAADLAQITSKLQSKFPDVFVVSKTIFGQEAFIVFPDGDPAAEVQP
jgi:hypothetical protein